MVCVYVVIVNGGMFWMLYLGKVVVCGVEVWDDVGVVV